MESEGSKNTRNTLQGVGAMLRAERLRQGLTTADVSSSLRIMESHVKNIEQGVEDDLPVYTYVIGYVRSYALLLKLDPDLLCRELRAAVAADDVPQEYEFVQDKVAGHSGSGRIAMMVLVASFVLYAGWYGLSANDGHNLIPEAPASSAQTSPTQASSTQDVDVLSSNQPQNQLQNQPQHETEQPLTTKPLSTGVAHHLGALNKEIPNKVTDAQAVGRVLDHEMTLTATASSWMKVTRADGSAVTAKLMQAGDVYVVPDGEDLYLTTGNAGGLTLTLDDDVPITLGGWGETVLELPLDRLIISQRY